MTTQASPTERFDDYRSRLPDYLSNSQLNAITACMRKYALRYIERVPRHETGYFIGGNAVHHTIEWAEGTTPAAWDALDPAAPMVESDLGVHFLGELQRLVDEVHGPIEWSKDEDQRWWQNNGLRMLARYAALRRFDEEQGWMLRPGGAEMQLMAELPWSRTMLNSRIDAFLFVSSDGEAVIRDYSTGRVHGKKPMQFWTYGWAVREALGFHAIGQAVYLRAAQMPLMLEYFDLPDEVLEEVPAIYEGALAAREAQLDLGTPPELWPVNQSAACWLCDVRDSCSYWAAQQRALGEGGTQ